jgi:23S rRNA pseudouridine2605 synthase
MTAGRVTVNGTIVRELGSKVDPGRDLVCIDGKPISLSDTKTYLMLNKPAGYLTTMDDPQNRPTIRELVPLSEYPGLFPVGRLDYDTTGLLLFTTDGDLAHVLLHPSHKVAKRYRVLVDGAMSEAEAQRLREGVVLNDGPTQPALIAIGKVTRKKLSAREERRLGQDTTFSPFMTTVHCTITEGRKRQVKRMFAYVGFEVMALEREAFGPLELGSLRCGSYRMLTEEEVVALRAICAG